MSADLDLESVLRQCGWSSQLMASDGVLRARIAALDVAAVIRLSEPAKAEAGAIASAALYRAWVEQQPPGSTTTFIIWFNLGAELSQLGDKAGAEICWRNALVLKPDFYQAAVNLGILLEAKGQTDQALAVWSGALQSDEARVALLNQQGRLQETAGLFAEAERTLYASLLTRPGQHDVIQHWTMIRQKLALWPVFGDGVPRMTPADIRTSVGPISSLALVDDIVEQTRIVTAWLHRRPEWSKARRLAPSGYRHDKIRIGYLSSDFCMHPMSFLIAELIEQHDRTDFEIYGYCCSPEDGSPLRKRVLAAFDRVTLIGDMSDEAAAERIRADEIDILVDLNGATKGMRLGVLRAKPAPVQVTYLGFVGPVPVPELDYLLCDDFTVPRHDAVLYKPQPLYIPGCYQANDSRLPVGAPVTRAQYGLPDDKFVFCCFSNGYKVTEHVFDAWMEILNRTTGTVLWLLEDNKYVRANMEARARMRGVDPARLAFTGRVSADAYLARMRVADLFLDTHPYNAGTTASDALRMGLPIVTLSGRAFAARMAGSLLRTVGLPSLAARDVEGYVAKAVELATNPAVYREIRSYLEGGAWARTLGDAPGFARRLESVYRQIRKEPEVAKPKADWSNLPIPARVIAAA